MKKRRGPNLKNLLKLVSSGDEDAAFEKAARDAFRSDTTVGPGPSLGPSDLASAMPATVTADAVAPSIAGTPTGRAPHPEPSGLPAKSLWATGRPTSLSAWVPVMGPEPAVEPSASGEPASESDPDGADAVARWPRRLPGDTAPDHLMRVPPSVGSTTDDFFDGIVRRVERDR